MLPNTVEEVMSLLIPTHVYLIHCTLFKEFVSWCNGIGSDVCMRRCLFTAPTSLGSSTQHFSLCLLTVSGVYVMCELLSSGSRYGSSTLRYRTTRLHDQVPGVCISYRSWMGPGSIQNWRDQELSGHCCCPFSISLTPCAWYICSNMGFVSS